MDLESTIALVTKAKVPDASWSALENWWRPNRTTYQKPLGLVHTKAAALHYTLITERLATWQPDDQWTMLDPLVTGTTPLWSLIIQSLEPVQQFLATTDYVVPSALLPLIDRPSYLYHCVFEILWALKLAQHEHRWVELQAMQVRFARWLAGDPSSAPLAARPLSVPLDQINAMACLLALCTTPGQRLMVHVPLSPTSLTAQLNQEIRALLRWQQLIDLPVGLVLTWPQSLHELKMHPNGRRFRTWFT